MIFYVLSNAGGGVCFSTVELRSADGFLSFRCFQKVCSIHVMRESIFVVSLQFCEIKKNTIDSQKIGALLRVGAVNFLAMYSRQSYHKFGFL